MSDCEPCPAGTRGISEGLDQCEACPAGFVSRLEGSSICNLALPPLHDLHQWFVWMHFHPMLHHFSRCACAACISSNTAEAMPAPCPTPHPELWLAALKLSGFGAVLAPCHWRLARARQKCIMLTLQARVLTFCSQLAASMCQCVLSSSILGRQL